LLITDPNLQIFRANSQAINVLSAGDWKTISGTSYTTSYNQIGHGENWSPFGFVGYQATTTYDVRQQAKTDVLGPYDKLGNTYALNNNYITDITILPYIRPQQVVARTKGMLFNTPVKYYFEGTDVTNYVRKGNVIELTGVTGTFAEGDIIGYYSSGAFTPTARILGVYVESTGVRLYVAADPYSTTYTTNGTLQNAFFDTNGSYQSTSASGTVTSTNHFGGTVKNTTGTTIKLSGLASSNTDIYSGNTLYVINGTGVGQSATISSYNGTTKLATLSSSITAANGDIYSIGSLGTDEVGSFYGVFNLPENQFHTGQRVLRVDNGVNGNKDTATTYAEGTFYSEGLQTTQQQIDFGASPSGAKGTFTQTNYANTTSTVVTTSPWDPVAQTFIVSKDNYPNGMFLESVKLFFTTKPTNDNSPVTLSIVGTQNGYPNG